MTTPAPLPSAADRIGALVADVPARAVVLERFGIDFCCGGARSLAEACREAGAAVDEVLAALADAPGDAHQGFAAGAPLEVILEHLEGTHHAYLHEELPALTALAAKVASVHGGRHPELAEVEALYGALRADLEPHLAKEEQVLFPAVRRIVGAGGPLPSPLLNGPAGVMGREHEAAGELLQRLRAATGGYAVPADACPSYRSLYERLEALEHDTHLHIAEENNVLFPAVATSWAVVPQRGAVPAS